MDKYQVLNGTYYDRRTPRAVVEALERVRQNHQQIRLYYGEPETGLDWNEENDVEGHIGRSLGPIKVPLLVAPKEIGGPQLLDHCIVKLRFRGGRVLWQHGRYHTRPFSIRPGHHPNYSVEVLRDGEVHARFKVMSDAERYVRFMTT